MDALLWTNQILEDSPSLESDISSRFPFLANFSRMILITGHRRENFGEGFERICSAIARLSLNFPDVAFVYPVHLNPERQSSRRKNALFAGERFPASAPRVSSLLVAHEAIHDYPHRFRRNSGRSSFPGQAGIWSCGRLRNGRRRSPPGQFASSGRMLSKSSAK